MQLFQSLFDTADWFQFFTENIPINKTTTLKPIITFELLFIFLISHKFPHRWIHISHMLLSNTLIELEHDHDYQKNSYLKSQPHVLIGDVLYFDIADIHLAMSHIPGVAENQLQDEPVDIWIHGHTHRLKNEMQNGVLQLNPGSLMDESSYLILNTETKQAKQHFLK